MADEFAHDVGRKLCLQLCSLAGYGAASDGTLDVLSDLVKMFLRESSVGARSYAENAGRTETNAKDIAMSLDDLGYGIDDLKEFATSSAEIPFGASVPKFPVLPISEDYLSFKDAKQKPPEHVPSFMPTFPSDHTYRETAVYVQPQQDEKTKAIRAHEVKKMTEDVLMQLDGGNDKPEDPFASLLVEEEEDEAVEKLPINKRERKMASNWTELLLGRLQQNDETTDPTTQLLPNASLSSVASFDPQETSQLVKKRKKETKSTVKEKKVKSTTTSFSSMLKFNLQPTPPAESVTDNPSIATEELDPLPAVQEGSLETDDFDLFGGGTSSLPNATEEIDSSEVVGDASSVLDGMPIEAQAPEEVEEMQVFPTSPTKSEGS